MLNIVELERRWLRYKIKSYIPHLSIVISLVVIFILGLFFYSSKETAPTPHVEKKVTHTIVAQPIKKDVKAIVKEKIVQSKDIATAEKNSQNVVSTYTKQELTPSMDFMRRIQNSVQPYMTEETSKEFTTVAHQQTKKSTSKTPTKQEAIQTVEQTPPPKINIQREDTKNDIRDIIKRFQHNKNPALSLFVAKKSYELGDYKQAYNYALITNTINSDIETSWIVFAKSLVKLGKTEKAIQTLKKYIKYSNSGNAKILLENIISGKFR